MEKNLIRLLKADEIECRISAVNAKGLSLLLYKDARADQRILDETFGPFGWKRSHQCIDGNLYCTVEILDRETGEWVAKQDVGTSGYTEKEKSQASDSFKRACFNWGIGRELYSAPYIWIPADRVNIQMKNDKYCCYGKFTVMDIGYSGERGISSIRIADERGRTVYEMVPETKSGPEKSAEGLSEKQMNAFSAELERTGVDIQTVKERYQIGNPREMSQELYEKAMKALARTKSVHAA